MKTYHTTIISLEAQYLYRRGREMLDQQRVEIALVYLRQAVFIAPAFIKAYQDLAECLERIGRPEEASAYRMKAFRIGSIPCGDVIKGVVRQEQDQGPAYLVSS